MFLAPNRGVLPRLTNYVVGQTFPFIATALGPYAFVPFGAVLLGATVFAYYCVPETRGRTLDSASLSHSLVHRIKSDSLTIPGHTEMLYYC